MPGFVASQSESVSVSLDTRCHPPIHFRLLVLHPLALRLMAGQQILDLFVGVRVPEGQPKTPKAREKSALFPL